MVLSHFAGVISLFPLLLKLHLQQKTKGIERGRKRKKEQQTLKWAFEGLSSSASVINQLSFLCKH